MIAGCIDKMRHEDCGSCERKDACASFFSGLFAPGGAFAAMPRTGAAPTARPRPTRGERPTPASGLKPFLSFLGRVASALEVATTPKPTAKKSSALRKAVEERIEPMLATGGIRIAEVARGLGLSRQTLYRRLKAEGVTFEELLDGLRRRLALRYIRDEGLSVKETAYRLGFSDPAAFSRAFKRWTGSSPTSPNR
ncbi:MAG TPA: helix-turn-helix domain-containing protein [Allosphingosinicella sp.]|jgi:AraC-like DNA-binding protein